MAKRFLARTLEGRQESDVFHTYYRANDAARIHHVARATGYEVEDITYVSTLPVWTNLPPLALVELLLLRLLRRPSLAQYRSNIFCTLRKSESRA